MSTAFIYGFVSLMLLALLGMLVWAVQQEEYESDRAEHEAIERKVRAHERAKALRFSPRRETPPAA